MQVALVLQWTGHVLPLLKHASLLSTHHHPALLLLQLRKTIPIRVTLIYHVLPKPFQRRPKVKLVRQCRLFLLLSQFIHQ